MDYREVTCAMCGKKITDRSTNHAKLYCSAACNHLAYRIRNGMVAKAPTFSCIHNQYVECQIHNCGTCGWNPEVAQKRIEAFMREVEIGGEE